jgi:hypothetical protein
MTGIRQGEGEKIMRTNQYRRVQSTNQPVKTVVTYLNVINLRNKNNCSLLYSYAYKMET